MPAIVPDGGGLDAAPVDASDALAIDASDASPPPPDGGNDGATCDPSKPFGTPVLLQNVNGTSANDEAPRLTPDELAIYFDSDRVNGNNQIYVATRTSTATPFGAPAVAPGTSSGNNTISPTVPADQLELLFSSLRSGGAGGYDIWSGARTSVANPFTNLASLALNSPADDADPFLRADGAELWFVSDRAGWSGTSDIYRAPASGATFANPVLVTELNAPSTVARLPALSSDALTVFWSSDRKDGTTSGGIDIWTAHRASTTAAFTGLATVAELNSTSDDLMGWISPDSCRVYFSSARGLDGQHLYMAARP